jgi:hypothetical protein
MYNLSTFCIYAGRSWFQLIPGAIIKRRVAKHAHQPARMNKLNASITALAYEIKLSAALVIFQTGHIGESALNFHPSACAALSILN